MSAASPATIPLVDRKNPFSAEITDRERLTSAESEKEAFHLTLDLQGGGLNYKCGDSLGVYPENPAATVAALLAALHLDGAEPVQLPNDPTGETIPIRDALTRKLALRYLTKPLLQLARDNAADPAEKQTLSETLALADPAQLKAWLDAREVPDLFREFPSIRLAPQELVSQLRKFTPRLYSISSSPRKKAAEGKPDTVDLIVDVVSYEIDGHKHEGVCSNYLAHHAPLRQKSVRVFLAPSHFAPPADPTAPLIMVGPGVGIAPFRSFLQDREILRAEGNKIGPNWLFFGNWNPQHDFLYKDELEAWQRDDLLTKLSLAWSRVETEETRKANGFDKNVMEKELGGKDKIYVQDLMWMHRAELWEWMDKKGAYFHVCGDAKRMAKDVNDTLLRIAEECGQLSADDAKRYIDALRHPAAPADQPRYQRDVY